jgi:iron complex outermembrane receptor protein
VFLGAPSPTSLVFLGNVQLLNQDHTYERSFFGHLTVHVTKSDEIAAGVRFIHFEDKTSGTLQTSATTPAKTFGLPYDATFDPVIYTGSITHHFNNDVMIYASTGSSWRLSGQTNGLLDQGDLYPWGIKAALFHLPPETSKSYEIGFKSSWLDRRLIANVTVYHQDFDNFFYNDGGVLVVDRTAIPPGGSLTGPNPGDTYSLTQLGIYGVPVPVKVDGVEADLGIQPLPRWSINGTFSYSVAKIKDASVPCNPPPPVPATGAQFVALAGGEQIFLCRVNYRAGFSAPFGFSLQSEYSHPLTGTLDGFGRGLLTFNSTSENNPANPLDDIPAYAVFNLYLGVRGSQTHWDLTAYAKNLFDAQRVLSRGQLPLGTSYLTVSPPTFATTGGVGATGYRGITMTAPREFGLIVNYAFGSR